MPAGLVVTTEETRASLIEALTNLNAKAKAERRRGHVGIHGPRYKELHDAMEPVVDGILFRQRLGLDKPRPADHLCRVPLQRLRRERARHTPLEGRNH